MNTFPASALPSSSSYGVFSMPHRTQGIQKAIHNQSKARKAVRKPLDHLSTLPIDGEEDIQEDIQDEAARTRAISRTVGRIIAANTLVIRSRVAANNQLIGNKILPEILEE